MNGIVKKDPSQMKMTKRTPSTVAAGAPGDTWHLPPRREAAGPAATASGGTLRKTGYDVGDRTGWPGGSLPPQGLAAALDMRCCSGVVPKELKAREREPVQSSVSTTYIYLAAWALHQKESNMKRLQIGLSDSM